MFIRIKSLELGIVDHLEELVSFQLVRLEFDALLLVDVRLRSTFQQFHHVNDDAVAMFFLFVAIISQNRIEKRRADEQLIFVQMNRVELLGQGRIDANDVLARQRRFDRRKRDEFLLENFVFVVKIL